MQICTFFIVVKVKQKPPLAFIHGGGGVTTVAVIGYRVDVLMKAYVSLLLICGGSLSRIVP